MLRGVQQETVISKGGEHSGGRKEVNRVEIKSRCRAELNLRGGAVDCREASPTTGNPGIRPGAHAGRGQMGICVLHEWRLSSWPPNPRPEVPLQKLSSKPRKRRPILIARLVGRCQIPSSEVPANTVHRVPVLFDLQWQA